MTRFALYFLFIATLTIEAFRIGNSEHRSRVSGPASFPQNREMKATNRRLPSDFDWRKQGVITSVKNQGKLNVPGAFAVVGAIESAWAIQTGKLYVLSEQEVVDCSRRSAIPLQPGETFETVSRLGGLELNATYPYIAEERECKLNKSQISVQIDGYVRIHNEDTLARYVMKNGPIAVGMAGRAHLQSYTKGILRLNETECSTSEYDHVALIVGFGTENGIPYWILKNSWGEKWGEGGYFRMHRGSNMCGVAGNAFAPYFFVGTN